MRAKHHGPEKTGGGGVERESRALGLRQRAE